MPAPVRRMRQLLEILLLSLLGTCSLSITPAKLDDESTVMKPVPEQRSRALRGISPTEPSKPVAAAAAPEGLYNPENIFSACLLVMDDNHKLSEWLAYHYYALNLRHLVITVDPHSRTSPKSILDRWRSRMTIEEWTDTNFMKQQLLRDPEHEAWEAHDQHKFRQRKFYNRCIRHLNKKRRSWTIFVDTDEYITLNSQMVNDTATRMQTPGHVSDYFVNLNREVQEAKDNEHAKEKHFGKKCVLLPRTLYGAVESSDEEVSQQVPAFLNGKYFDTMRWRHRSVSSKTWMLSKGVLDVSDLTRQELRSKATAHRPSALACKTSEHWVPYALPIGVHHYLGSWESYNYRDDIRGGQGGNHHYEAWKSKGSHQFSTDDEIRPWIQGFVSMVGESAKVLLEGAGELA